LRETAAFLKKVLVLTLAGCAMAAMDAASEPSGEPSFADERSPFDAIEQLSEAQLKEFYVRCARDSVRGRLGHGEIALCSIGYERLLKGPFRGDFRAFLEWRRSLTRSSLEAPATEAR
jgi:hypothetical protein